MKKTIKIDFSDFWGGFDKTNNYFYNLLKDEFDVRIVDGSLGRHKPDYLFFSVFGNQHQYYNCTKIAYFAENIPAPLGYCQWAFSNDYLDDKRNYRLPHYLLYDGYYELERPKFIEKNLANRKFCNFIVSNGQCQERNNFFVKLNNYKKVDSGGRFMNNLGYAVSDKVKFQSEYKFSIAYENNAYRSQHPGYTTEKIMQPMTVNSIPIYWGNPVIDREFNTKSFVNFYDFKNENDMIDYIIELDKNDDMYLDKLNQPWFTNGIPEPNKEDNIKSFLYKIFQ